PSPRTSRFSGTLWIARFPRHPRNSLACCKPIRDLFRSAKRRSPFLCGVILPTGIIHDSGNLERYRSLYHRPLCAAGCCAECGTPGQRGGGLVGDQGISAARQILLLVRALAARAILELGTLGGYSTIWLAWARPLVAA